MPIRSKKKVIVSLTINAILIALGLFALSEVLFRYLPGSATFPWYYSMTYYTNLSNIILIVGEPLCLVQDIRELRHSKEVSIAPIVKYIGATTTLVTCSTVYFFVFTSGNWSFGLSMSGNMWLFFHTICPLGGALSFILLDQKQRMPICSILLPIAFTILYTSMIHILYFAGGRIPYASDFTDEPLEVNFLFIFVLGSIETAVTALWAFLVRLLINMSAHKDA